MPLKQKKMKKNISELIRSFKKKGKIGRVKPKDKDHARRIALAIAYDKRKRKGK